MNILIAHNFYQRPGGEEKVFASEDALLTQKGHSVFRIMMHNHTIDRMSAWQRASNLFWNQNMHEEVYRTISENKIEIAYFHNIFPLISPSVYYAAQKAGAVVIQRLPNYRLLCPNALFLRRGQVCEDCLGHIVPWPGIVHSCYRNSRIASSATALMVSFHRLKGTWQNIVDRYVALNSFARDKFISGGLPPEKVVIKPNFMPEDPGRGDGRGGYALFVGRFSVEKGLSTLLDAWKLVGSQFPLLLVGDGPEEDSVRQASKTDSSIHWLGRKANEQVMILMKGASFLVLPSICYENFPNTLIEAYSCGTPVIASYLGSLPGLVIDGKTGLLFRPGDPTDLAEKIRWAFEHPVEWAAMRENARAEYEAKYTAERNYELLMQIYQDAIKSKRRL